MPYNRLLRDAQLRSAKGPQTVARLQTLPLSDVNARLFALSELAARFHLTTRPGEIKMHALVNPHLSQEQTQRFLR